MTRWRPAVVALAVAGALASSGAPGIADFAFDRLGRVAAVPGRQEVACPAPGNRVAVLAVAGQSNAGNHGSERAPLPRSVGVINFYRGRCTLAESPLLGATGRGNAYWELLAARLIESGRYDKVVIAPFAIAGSRISRWAAGGDLHEPWMRMLVELNASHPVTHILWHQGEADFLFATPSQDYAAHLGSIARRLHAAGLTAPLYVASATRCTRAPWTPDHPVARAQKDAAQTLPRVRAGADADAVWAPGDRFDDCHLSQQGQRAMAARWAERLLNE